MYVCDAPAGVSLVAPFTFRCFPLALAFSFFLLFYSFSFFLLPFYSFSSSSSLFLLFYSFLLFFQQAFEWMMTATEAAWESIPRDRHHSVHISFLRCAQMESFSYSRLMWRLAECLRRCKRRAGSAQCSRRRRAATFHRFFCVHRSTLVRCTIGDSSCFATAWY